MSPQMITAHADLQPSQHPSYKNLVEQKFELRCTEYDKKDNYHYKVAAELVARARLQPGWNVLDVACGTGLATCLAASEVGQTGSVTGVDLSSGMIEQVCQHWFKHDCCSKVSAVATSLKHYCRQRPNCTSHLVPISLSLWRMQSMPRFKEIPLMRLCLRQECPTLTQQQCPRSCMHG